MARWLCGNFIFPGARRLSCSAPLESRSPTDVFAVSVVFREADVRSLAGDHFFSACPHERGGVRLTRAHLGIRTVGLPQTNVKLTADDPGDSADLTRR